MQIAAPASRFRFNTDGADWLHCQVLAREAMNPLPPGWRYRREFQSGFDGNTWRIAITSVPEPDVIDWPYEGDE